jgi:hypothetical protein
MWREYPTFGFGVLRNFVTGLGWAPFLARITTLEDRENIIHFMVISGSAVVGSSA